MWFDMYELGSSCFLPLWNDPPHAHDKAKWSYFGKNDCYEVVFYPLDSRDPKDWNYGGYHDPRRFETAMEAVLSRKEFSTWDH